MQISSQNPKKIEFKMKSVKFKLDKLHALRINEIPVPDNTIELLCNDGKVTANRLFLRIASSAVHARLLENPDLNILDLKNHKKSTIDLILNGIYTGQTTFKDEIEEEEVSRLAQELDIGIVQLAMTGENVVENIKVDAPAVPQEEPKNEDPGILRLKDGTFSCGLCFMKFSSLFSAKRHYQNMHFASKEKNISCRAQGCDKKFCNMGYMKMHMLRIHGISAKLIPSTSSAKSSTKSTKPTKKGVKREPSKKVIKSDESQNIKDELFED